MDPHRLGTPSTRPLDRLDRNAIEDRRTQGGRRAQIRQHQVRVVRGVLAVGAGEGELLAVEQRLLAGQLLRVEAPVTVCVRDGAELLVGSDARAELQ